jgi:hypothetical protein
VKLHPVARVAEGPDAGGEFSDRVHGVRKAVLLGGGNGNRGELRDDRAGRVPALRWHVHPFLSVVCACCDSVDRVG